MRTISKICAINVAKAMTSLIFLALSSHAMATETDLTIDKSSITKENKQYTWINFSDTASNGKIYRGSITCYTADRTYNNKAHGSMNVLRAKYHAGAYVDFSYDECIEMIDGLSRGTEELVIYWNQEEFDDLSSGKLSFERIIY